MASRDVDHRALPLLLVSALLTCACGAPPRSRPVAMVALPALAPPVVPSVRLHVGEAASRIEDAVLVEVDRPDVVRIYEQDGVYALIGKSRGTAVVHFRSREGDTRDLRVEVVPGEPAQRALTIGETVVVPLKGVKEFSVGIPGIVDATVTSDGSRLVITGRRAGTTTVLLLESGGGQRSHELVVVAGERRS